MPPSSSILTVPNWLTIKFHTSSSIHSTVKFQYCNSIGYHSYRYPVSFIEFSLPYWSSHSVYHTLSLPALFLPYCILLTTMQNHYTRLSTNSFLSIKFITPTPNNKI
jgi:hypothetical protein